MKTIILIWLMCLLPVGIYAQEHASLEAIGEFSDSLLAIKKADKWGFADSNNNLTITYRSDITAERYRKNGKVNTPAFKEGLCIIKAYIKGIPYYGFIDKNGTTVVEPTFLNVTNFYNNYAIAIVVEKKSRGKNEYLNKEIIAYSFYEAVINRKGNIVKDLGDVPHILMSKERYKKPYSTTHFVSPTQVAVETSKGEWQLISIDQNQ